MARQRRFDEQRAFDDETALEPTADPGRFTIQVSDRWNIGENPNGGYLMALLLRACVDAGELAGTQPDPITLSTHFLRPGLGAQPGEISAVQRKRGRTMSTWRAALTQADKPRVEMMVGFGDLTPEPDDDADAESPSDSADEERVISIAPPDIPGPEDCIDRRVLNQGVDMPILDRVDVRVPPERAELGAAPDAVMTGWIRFADQRPPDTLSLPLFADAFPPSLFVRYGRIGWVPTLEMTVQVRRRPADGWILAQFECDDLHNGSMIETGALWDEEGHLVARSRQLGLLLS